MNPLSPSVNHKPQSLTPAICYPACYPCTKPDPCYLPFARATPLGKPRIPRAAPISLGKPRKLLRGMFQQSMQAFHPHPAAVGYQEHFPATETRTSHLDRRARLG